MELDLPPGALTSALALQSFGYGRSWISRRVKAGELVPEPRARGLYLNPAREQSAHHDLLVVSLYAPASVFCLLTAAQLHGLRAPAPDIWLTVPASCRIPDLPQLPLTAVRPRSALGREDVVGRSIDGVPIRYTSAAKTVAVCFQYRSRVGLDIAVAALRAALRRGASTGDEIWRCACAGGVNEVMLPYLEAMS